MTLLREVLIDAITFINLRSSHFVISSFVQQTCCIDAKRVGHKVYQLIKLKRWSSVESLLDLSWSIDSNNSEEIMKSVCRHGKLDVLNKLLDQCGLKPNYEEEAPGVHCNPFELAAENGHLDVVNRLLEDHRVDPSSNWNYSIKWASAKGHSTIVDVLLKDPRVNSSADLGTCLEWAVLDRHWDIALQFLNDLRVDPQSGGIHNSRPDSPYFSCFVIQEAWKYDRCDVVIKVLSRLDNVDVKNYESRQNFNRVISEEPSWTIRLIGIRYHIWIRKKIV